VNAYRQCLFLIRMVSRVVPASNRESWLHEWEAEVWYAWTAMRQRGETPAFVRSQLREFCKGCVADAAWHRRERFDREEMFRVARNWMRSPGFCLGALSCLILMIAVTSGFFSMTRAVLLPLPYDNAERVATVSQGGMSLAVRSGIPAEWVGWWQRQSRLVESAATYRWLETSGHSYAQVSDNFFSVLGAGPDQGRTFHRGDSTSCADCAVLSYEIGLRNDDGWIRLGRKSYRVIGVMPRDFWFLSRRIEVWTLSDPPPKSKTGVVVRLRPEVSTKAAKMELDSIVNEAGLSLWGSLVDVSPVQERVRAVFWSFALALGLALVIAVAGLQSMLPRFEPAGCPRALFFASKTGLLLLAVLLAGVEFTRAPSITMIGGTDLLTEPLSTWLFLMGCMGALSWSIHDQRRRCRVCLRRLGMAAHVGCPGCLLLNWAGTELVCIEGHGMLHVPEMLSSWHQAEQWTALDDSWLPLFARK
jgi:hypothetical protein